MILGGPTRARPIRAQGARKGPARKGPGGPTSAIKVPRAQPTRAQEIVASWQGPRARFKATTRVVVHIRGGCGPSWARPLWAPWALMRQALMGLCYDKVTLVGKISR